MDARHLLAGWIRESEQRSYLAAQVQIESERRELMLDGFIEYFLDKIRLGHLTQDQADKIIETVIMRRRELQQPVSRKDPLGQPPR